MVRMIMVRVIMVVVTVSSHLGSGEHITLEGVDNQGR